MAGSKKKKSTEKNTNDVEQMDTDTMILADFEGRNPDASDFDGIKQLLKQLFLKAHVNISELSDMVIAQQGLGSVLKQADDEPEDDDDDDDIDVDNTVFGVTTIIHLSENMQKGCVSDLINLLKSLTKDYGDKKIEDDVEKMLSQENNKIGLLLNERFINVPAKIADPLMSSLLGEITRLAKKNPSFNFDYYIMICKMHKQINKDSRGEEIHFANAEEEIFSKSSEFSFEFSVANESDTGVGGSWTEDDVQMIPMRRVLFIKSNKLPTIVEEIRQFVK